MLINLNEIPILKNETSDKSEISNFTPFRTEKHIFSYSEKEVISLKNDQILQIINPDSVFNLHLSSENYLNCIALAHKFENEEFLEKIIIRICYQKVHLKHLIENFKLSNNKTHIDLMKIQRKISSLNHILDKVAILEEKFSLKKNTMFLSKNKIKLNILEVLCNLIKK